MLPANLSNALRLLARGDKPLVTPAAGGPAAKLAIGQQVQGTVVAQLRAGIYNVTVAGETVQMRLPSEVRTGALIDLRVVATSPQLALSFLAASTPLSTREQIGATARLLADLAELPGKRAPVQAAGNAAIWPAHDSAPDSKQLAAALRTALANSGLFYESHQAEWVQGTRNTAQLLLEPQNRLPDLHPDSGAAQSRDAAPVLAGNASQSAAPLPVARELLPLVQHQLHALETQQLGWMGSVWPGQQMQWEIQGEAPHAQPQPEEERRWRTSLELALPALGDVRAALSFSALGLELRLQAAHPETLRLFERALPGLRTALAQADITLTATMVEPV